MRGGCLGRGGGAGVGLLSPALVKLLLLLELLASAIREIDGGSGGFDAGAGFDATVIVAAFGSCSAVCPV